MARAGRLAGAFAELAERGAEVERQTYLPGEVIPWPVPIRIGTDWSLRFHDQPAVTLLHSLGFDNTDGQLTIVSNNVLLERLDSAQINYTGDDRQVTYWGSTTASTGLNEWRVRPALATDRPVRGPNFDKLSISIGGPLHGFGSSGQPIRKPSYELAVSYRLNWFSEGSRRQTLVDPRHELCISEQPLDPQHYRVIRAEVELYRKATIGALPLVLVSKPRQLQAPDDYYEANYDSSSGVALVNSFYVTSGNHPTLQLVVDRLLGSAIFLSAARSPVPKLVRRVQELASGFSQAMNDQASIAIFVDAAAPQRISNESELFAEGLNVMRHRPSLFLKRFAALDSDQQRLARSLKNDLVALTRLALDLNGHRDQLSQFVPQEIQQL